MSKSLLIISRQAPWSGPGAREALDIALAGGAFDLPIGMLFLDDGEVLHLPAFPVEAVDTLGAGDVWHGAFALALAEGQGERAAIRFASATAALKCTRFGGRSGTPRREEVERFLAAAG